MTCDVRAFRTSRSRRNPALRRHDERLGKPMTQMRCVMRISVTARSYRTESIGSRGANEPSRAKLH